MPNKTNNLDLVLIMCPAWGAIQPPVGISYLKGFLKNYDINVKCFDLSIEFYNAFPQKQYWDLNYPEYFVVPYLFEKDILPVLTPFINIWTERILSYKPKAVGFSLFTSSINVSLLLAHQLKKRSPDLIILGGGAEATRIKRIEVDGIRRIAGLNKMIIADDIFDVLIEGEGEKALLEILLLIKQNRDFHNVEGILYKKDGKFIANRSRDFLELDTMSFPPDYDDFELCNYTERTLPLVTSRGCINRCTFCSDSPLWKIYRYRSPENVIEDIKFLTKQYRKREFEIVDSTFNGNIQRVDRICDLIIASKLYIKWSAKVTLRKEMSYELLIKMKKAGCCSLAYGVESGSPCVLNDMRKNTNIGEGKRIIEDTWRAGIRANCFFIIGYPTETEKDFQMTLNFIQKNARFIYCFDQITGCHIEEDSYLGRNLDKYGVIFKEDGWHSQDSTPAIRRERLEKFRDFARRLHKHYQCEVQA